MPARNSPDPAGSGPGHAPGSPLRGVRHPPLEIIRRIRRDYQANASSSLARRVELVEVEDPAEPSETPVSRSGEASIYPFSPLMYNPRQERGTERNCAIEGKGVNSMCLRMITAIFVFTGALFGQGGTGAISGSVTDTSGAVVPGATVVAINETTGFQRATAAGSAGEYTIVGLQPGTYTVTAEHSGFKKFTVRGLVLQVDQNARVDVHFEVGAVTEVIEVVGQPALLQTEQSSVGAVVDRQKIVEFPLNGRNFVQLGLLLPGVNTGDDGSATGGGISVSGLRPEQNSFLLDGTTNSDQYQNYLVIRPSVDAIEEFKIQTSNYSAEFGKGAGGQINVVTRGGTNELHGTLFEFNRNNAVQARNLFDSGRCSSLTVTTPSRLATCSTATPRSGRATGASRRRLSTRTSSA